MNERRKHGQRKKKYSPRVHEMRERERKFETSERLNNLHSNGASREFIRKTEPMLYADPDLNPMERGVEYQID